MGKWSHPEVNMPLVAQLVSKNWDLNPGCQAPESVTTSRVLCFLGPVRWVEGRTLSMF